MTSRVFRYAIATGRAENDPAAALGNALPRAEVTHFAAITDPVEIGELRVIDSYDGQPTGRDHVVPLACQALEILPLELRKHTKKNPQMRSLSHTKWECQYHVAFIPKYRWKALYGQLRRHLGEVFRRLAE